MVEVHASSKTREANGVNSRLSPKAWAPGVPVPKDSRWTSQLREEEHVHSSPSCLFSSGPQQIGGCPLHWCGRALLSLHTQTLIPSWHTLAGTPRSNILPQSRHPLVPFKFIYKSNHHPCLSSIGESVGKAGDGNSIQTLPFPHLAVLWQSLWSVWISVFPIHQMQIWP